LTSGIVAILSKKKWAESLFGWFWVLASDAIDPIGADGCFPRYTSTSALVKLCDHVMLCEYNIHDVAAVATSLISVDDPARGGMTYAVHQESST
jgi:hypothetical protein